MAAALKRAQAHHRRSSSAAGAHHDLLHPPSCLVPVRVDLDQLVLSILDDPSVSRVMREAGFSSTIVKTNLESNSEDRIKNPSFLFPQPKTDDVEAIFDVLLGKTRKNVVVVGDSPASAERAVSEFMDRFEKGDVPVEPLKSVKLIKLQFSTIPLKFMKKHEVDMNVGDLKRKVESFGFGGRVVIYIGDLKWAIEREGHDYDYVIREFDFSAIYRNPIDYLVSEIGKLVSWYNSSSSIRVWLMATADNETYAKCRMKKPSLEGQWDLEPVFVLSGGLGSSIDGMSSCWDSRITSKSYLCPHKEHDNNVPTSCIEYTTSNFEQVNGSAQLPYWLKPHGNYKVDLAQLRRTKYDTLISKNHYQSSPYPCWPNKARDDVPNSAGTISFSYPSLDPNQNPTSVPRFRRHQQSSRVDLCFSNGSAENQLKKPNLDSLKRTEGKDVKITLSLGNSNDHEKICELRELVHESVPWQCETIPMIVDSLVEYCCGEIKHNSEVWLIEGNDFVGKRRLAVGIAKAVFGSPDMLFCMNMRHNENYTVAQNRVILETALRNNNDKLVVFIENVDYADQEFVEFIVGKKVSCRAIFVLTTDGDVSCNHSVIPMKLLVSQESKHGLTSKSSLSSEVGRKRKHDSEFPVKGKNIQRKKHNEVEEVSSNGVETVLDLNVKADDHDEEQGNLSSISSELTREITVVERDDPNSLVRLKNIIKNQFAFNRDSDKDEKAREMLLLKIEGSFRNATNCNIGFHVEEDLLEEIRCRSGFYLNDLFGQWLKDIFQASLSMVGVHRDNVRVRLCLDGKLGECCEEDGYMGTCLPKRVPVCFQ
ncbi:Double Clp-N motif-containing P-loop nucleoside triphosphate hydrolases superfamily protein [Striga hermonthica]|uniref:Double Clp-N motif-containing P-loop nucleoside triphosphate hydrolases superfamily protein n=1 Tax=Striga hermonthica TaxID=68872 RepID=A0A9N7RA68_STRHE|nr:Double Clp-N motif-containing P-loop nucleoside triphosphate hydrolases superfamily protein [Striga hermonthica]